MRIAYLSDLHLEFDLDAPAPLSVSQALAPAKGADLVVLAGDIAHDTHGIAAADAIADLVEAPAVYVAGNHEAYGQDLPALLPRLSEAAWLTDGRVWLLNGSTARFWFGGRPIVVLGCTLWTDYALNGDTAAAMAAAARMNDHTAIGWNGGLFSPEQALSLHLAQRDWLRTRMAALALEKPRPAVLIVTHHAPCPQAIGPRVADFAPCYASDLREEIAAWGPLVWIHGHTHKRHDTRIGQARIVSAPRGYAGDDTYAGFSCGIVEV